MFPSSALPSPFTELHPDSFDENPSSFLFNFSPHLLDNDEILLGHLLHQQPHHHQGDEAAAATTTNTMELNTTDQKLNLRATTTKITNKRKSKDKNDDHEEGAKMGKKKRASTRQPVCSTPRRRRTGKKDRHSKIQTAQGPRDRRMRLSLPIARKFFDLQDLLGFDKASKTIDWLFTMSKAAIKELASSTLPVQKKNPSSRRANNAATTSEYIGTEIPQPETGGHVGGGRVDCCSIKVPMEDTRKVKNKNTTRKLGAAYQQQRDPHGTSSHTHPSLARASRDKARARARQRTMEKMQKMRKQMGGNHDQNQTNPSNDANNKYSSCNTNINIVNDLEKLGSSTTTPDQTTLAESAQGLNRFPANVVHLQQQHSLEHKMASSVDIVEKLLGAISSTSSVVYNYQMGMEDHGFLGFAGSSWMADKAGINNNSIPASSYDTEVMMGDGSSIISAVREQKYPNSFFIASSSSIYLQPHHHHHPHPHQFLQNQLDLL